ncbi:MAG TPA: hypothetical protein VGS23_06415 [Thermoplasmata archaeon]|nr:hypothetical protein [Thermoplasmata archaeon]
MSDAPTSKKPSIVLTVGSKVSVRSAGNDSDTLVSSGTFRGLVSIGGDSSLALELDGKVKEEKGRIRLIPINALLSLDVIEAMKVEEEKRTEPPATGYFR